MSAEVILWLPITGSASVGHAALAVISGDEKAYLSWWPQQSRNQQNSKRGEPYTVKGAKNETRFSNDLRECVGRPDVRAAINSGGPDKKGRELNPKTNMKQFHIPRSNEEVSGQKVFSQERRDVGKMPSTVITLLGQDEDGDGQPGLNIKAIIAWCRLISCVKATNDTTGDFRLYSSHKNCASMVISALVNGNAEAFVKKPSCAVAYTPSDVEAYAKKIKAGIEKARKNNTNIKRSESLEDWFGKEQDKPANSNCLKDIATDGSRIMTREQWETLSYVGRFASRKGQAREIDRLLVQFHNQAAGQINSSLPAKKILKELLQNVGSHLRLKPESKRREAMLILGCNILDYIERHAIAGVLDQTSMTNQVKTFDTGTPSFRIKEWFAKECNLNNVPIPSGLEALPALELPPNLELLSSVHDKKA